MPASDWSLQTKPGAESARALMESSWATKRAIFGSSMGARRRPILICARWKFMAEILRANADGGNKAAGEGTFAAMAEEEIGVAGSAEVAHVDILGE